MLKPHVHPQTSQKLSLFFSVFVFVFSFGFLFYRTQFGVDFFDEPYYSALALRWFLGQKLFVDELYLAQTFSILTFPFFSFYLKLTQSLEGIIFFMRACNALLYLGLGSAIYFSLKKELNTPFALLVAASSCLFFPGNMLAMGYNSLGTLFLTLSLGFVFLGIYYHRKWLLFLAGIGMGFACISYITFSAMALFLACYLFLFEKRKALSAYFVSGVAITLALPLLFIFTHWSNFLNAYAFGKEYHHEAPTLMKLLTVIHKFFPKKVLALVGIFFLLAHRTRYKYPLVFDFLISLIPLLAALCCRWSFCFWSGYPFYLPVLSLISFYRIKHTPFSQCLFRWVFVPSMVAGLITAGTSASGFFNAQVGLLPATLAGLLFVGLSLQNRHSKNSFLQVCSLALPVFLLLLFPLNVWSDSDFKLLTKKVTLGPYRGLYTSEEKQKITEQSFQALSPLLNTQGPLLVYPNGPAGYLIHPIPPARGVTWYENSGRTNEILANLYRAQMNPESRVIRMKVWYGSPTVKSYYQFDSTDVLNQLIESTHYPIKETEWFTVFAPKEKSPRS